MFNEQKRNGRSGVRVLVDSGDKEKASEAENRFADEAKPWILMAVASLESGKLKGIGRGNSLEEAAINLRPFPA